MLALENRVAVWAGTAMSLSCKSFSCRELHCRERRGRELVPRLLQVSYVEDGIWATELYTVVAWLPTVACRPHQAERTSKVRNPGPRPVLQTFERDTSKGLC